jgi:phage terminase Nu1 subunit (DNA packaging protein)
MASVPKKAKALPRAMSFSDYARHQRVSIQTVHNWHKQGFVKIISRGRVDVAASDEAIVDRGPIGPGSKSPQPPPAKPTVIDASSPYSHAEAMRVKENYAALARQLEYERDAGKVVEVAKIANVVAAKLANIRSKFRALGAVISPRGAACRTPDELKTLIDSEVDKVLEEIAAEAIVSIDRR